MSETKHTNEPIIKDPKQVTRALEILFTTHFIDKKRLYWENFLRGMFFGAGGVIGATVLIGLLLWILSLFDTVPLIGPLIDNTKETIRENPSVR